MEENKKNKIPNVPNLRFSFDGEWTKYKLPEIALFLPGLTYSPSDIRKDGKIVLRSSNIQNGLLDMHDLVCVNENIVKSDLKIKPFDILMCIRNGSKKLVGKTALITVDNPKLTWGAFMAIIRPKNKNSFVFHFLNSNSFFKQVFPDTNTATVNQITARIYNNCKAFVPSEYEQQKIGFFLDLINKRIETQNKIIEENKTLKNQLIETLIYGSSDVTYITLSDYCSLKNGYPFKSGCYVEGGKYSIITIGNVQGNRFLNMDSAKTIKSLPLDIQEHQILRKGDILISLTGNVGRVSIVDKDNCLLNQRVGLLTINDPTITEYVFQCLSSHKFELEMAKKGQGAAQLNIGNNDVTSYKIPVSMSNTDSIAKVLKKIDEKNIVEVKLKKLFSEQKKYLLENLFI